LGVCPLILKLYAFGLSGINDNTCYLFQKKKKKKKRKDMGSFSVDHSLPFY